MKIQTNPHLNQIAISLDTLTLTANQRIALRLQESYDQRQAEAGLMSWETPSIMPLTTWLNQLAQTIIPRQILSNNQELYLFEQIIQKTCDAQDILNPTDTASIAANAWKTLHLWNIDIHHLAQESNEEVALFYQWALQFQSQCEQHNWISSSEIPKKIIQALPLISYKKIQLIGFDDFPPIIEHLLKSIELQCEVIQVNIIQPPNSQHKIAFHDQASEIHAMAHWAKEQLRIHPKIKIGCIIPELNTLRRVLFNTFTTLLDSNQLLPGYPLNNTLFNMSAGQKISEYPMIHAALTVIHWLTNRIDLTLFSHTLQSPYLHQSSEECDYAAQLDRMLRELPESEHFSDLFRVDQNNLTSDQPELAAEEHNNSLLKRLYNLHLSIKSIPYEATLFEWKQYFSHALTTIGWPGYRILNSEEYQLYTRWLLLLDELTHYDTVTHDTITLSEALYLLQKIATNTLFQIEGSHAPIQILGTLEAAGNTFDTAWIMGMDDDSWPPMANPNPFLPYDMQRDKNMPHATAERELIYTQQVMNRLCNSAKQLIFSYPLFDGDKAKNPSQFLHDIESTTLAIPLHTVESSTHLAMESFIDATAPPVMAHEILSLSSSVLQQQSDCPFKAFANTRLKAKPLNNPTFGLRDNQRGLLIHDALDRLWAQLKSHKQLILLSERELTDLIEKTADAVMKDQQQLTSFKKELLLLEKHRLIILLKEWLSHEKERSPFNVVGTEISLQVPISTLTFKMRIDRIDQLETGKCIIDYKAHSHSSIGAWFGERPSDPQLPLYLHHHSNYLALAYAQVIPHNCQFKGLANNTDTAQETPGIKSIESFSKNTLTWNEQLIIWQKTMITLATEFEQGFASVTPKDRNKSCSYCELKPLCRVEMP